MPVSSSIRIEISKRAFINIYKRYEEKKKYPLKTYFLFYFFVAFVVGMFVIIYSLLCFTVTKQKLKYDSSSILPLKHNKRSQNKKSSDDIKGELLDSVVSIEKTDETVLNDAVRNAKDPKEPVAIIKEFEEL